MMKQTHSIFGRIHLAFIDDALDQPSGNLAYVSNHAIPAYSALCDDFGPVNLALVYQFCEMLEAELEKYPEKSIVVCAGCTRQSWTNAVFLIGAYMILKLDSQPDALKHTFAFLAPLMLPYRDISPGPQNFDLHLQDCWEALHRAKMLQWLEQDTGFDIEEYTHYGSAVNGDLHMIVPNKIIAMKGPCDIAQDREWLDKPDGSRVFSPKHYAEILTDFGVKLLVRLNAQEYDESEFESRGIAVVDLFFEHSVLPPDDVAIKFLLLAEGLPNAVAVHCKAGLGRTGTLIALYLMKVFSFTARQAIAWLRIVRPGSVIGKQQEYLCQMEPMVARLRDQPSSSARMIVEALTMDGEERVDLKSIEATRSTVRRIIDRVDHSRLGGCQRPPQGPPSSRLSECSATGNKQNDSTLSSSLGSVGSNQKEVCQGSDKSNKLISL